MDRKEWPQPRWNRPLQFHHAPALRGCCEPEGTPEIVVVEDPDIGEFAKSDLEILHAAWVPRQDLFRRHVVAALGNAHCDSLLADLRPRRADEAENHGVAGPGSLLKKADLVSNWIGKDRFKDKAFALADKFQTVARTRSDLASAEMIWLAAEQAASGTPIAQNWQRIDISDLCYEHAATDHDSKAGSGLKRIDITLHRADRIALSRRAQGGHSVPGAARDAACHENDRIWLSLA